jgi:type I restriction enzyme S subunit
MDRKTDTNLSPEEHLLVRKGDIAYNMMRMWQGASGLAQFDALVSPAYVVLKPTRDVDPVFASYLFKSARMIHLFWAYSYGLTSDRLRLYFADFSKIPTVLPPTEEQRRIGELLSTWDRAIETVDKLIQNTEAQKSALRQSLLSGDQRFAEHRVEEWAERSLHNLAHIVMGSSPKSDNYNQHATGLPLLQGNADIKDRVSAPRFYTSEITQTCEPNDILISVRAPVGAVAKSIHRACIGRGVAAIRPKAGTDSEFLYQLLVSHPSVPTLMRQFSWS